MPHFFARSLFCVTKLRFIKVDSSAVLLRLEGLRSRPFLLSSLRSVPLWIWNLEVSNSRQGIFFQEPPLWVISVFHALQTIAQREYAYKDKHMGMLGTNMCHSKFILLD